jgi:hypothetical protein
VALVVRERRTRRSEKEKKKKKKKKKQQRKTHHTRMGSCVCVCVCVLDVCTCVFWCCCGCGRTPRAASNFRHVVFCENVREHRVSQVCGVGADLPFVRNLSFCPSQKFYLDFRQKIDNSPSRSGQRFAKPRCEPQGRTGHKNEKDKRCFSDAFSYTVRQFFGVRQVEMYHRVCPEIGPELVWSS